MTDAKEENLMAGIRGVRTAQRVIGHKVPLRPGERDLTMSDLKAAENVLRYISENRAVFREAARIVKEQDNG